MTTKTLEVWGFRSGHNVADEARRLGLLGSLDKIQTALGLSKAGVLEDRHLATPFSFEDQVSARGGRSSASEVDGVRKAPDRSLGLGMGNTGAGDMRRLQLAGWTPPAKTAPVAFSLADISFVEDPYSSEKGDAFARRFLEKFALDPPLGLKKLLGDTDAVQALQLDDSKLARYIDQSIRFNGLAASERRRGKSSLFTDTVEIPPALKANGKLRPSERGPRIDLDYVRSQGIDPEQVLVFRRTQPGDKAKPEDYWTTDYAETLSGLTAEIPEQQRRTSVILVSTLAEVARGSGLMRDQNDDSGIAICRFERSPFDQRRSLAVVRHEV